MNAHTDTPALPPQLSRLAELAADLWWTWNLPAREVFRKLDYPLWRTTAHNPVRMLEMITPERLAEAAADPVFVRRYEEAVRGLDRARSAEDSWWGTALGGAPTKPIAYFSASAYFFSASMPRMTAPNFSLMRALSRSDFAVQSRVLPASPSRPRSSQRVA